VIHSAATTNEAMMY